METVWIYLMLTLAMKSNVKGPIKRLQKMVAKAQDLQPLYKRWGAYLRKESKARIDSGEGFAPLADSTQKRLKNTRKSTITTQGKVRKSYAKRLEGQLHRQVKADKLDEGVVDDLKDLLQGGKEALHMNLTDRRSVALVRLQKQLQKAQGGKRVGGDRRQSENHKLLGKLGQSLQAQGTKTEAMVENRVPWSQIHNEGGTAGHGAQIPARPFLVITPQTKQRLEALTVRYFTGDEDE